MDARTGGQTPRKDSARTLTRAKKRKKKKIRDAGNTRKLDGVTNVARVSAATAAAVRYI